MKPTGNETPQELREMIRELTENIIEGSATFAAELQRRDDQYENAARATADLIQDLQTRAEKAEAALATADDKHSKAILRWLDATAILSAVIGKDPSDWHNVTSEAMRSALGQVVATARAVMAEEVATLLAKRGYAKTAAEFRALAPLPAGLVVLPVEVVRRAATWIGEAIPALENGAEYNEEIARELFTTLCAALPPEGA